MTTATFIETLSSCKVDFQIKATACVTKDCYISTIEYANTFDGKLYSFFIDLFYKNNGEEIDFIVLNFNYIQLFENVLYKQSLEDLISQLFVKEVFESKKGRGWIVYDLWLGEELESNSDVLFESILYYVSNSRGVLDDFYNTGFKNLSKDGMSATKNAKGETGSIYQQILKLSPEVFHRNGTKNVKKLLEQITDQKYDVLSKYYLHMLINRCGETHFPSAITTYILSVYSFRISRDIDVIIAQILINYDVNLHGKLGDYFQILSKQVQDRENYPPRLYVLLSYYFLLVGNFESFYNLSLEGFKKYQLEELKLLLKNQKSRFAFKKRLKISLLVDGWLAGLTFFKYSLPYFAFFLSPLLTNVVAIGTSILPIIASKNTLIYLIDTDLLFGAPAFLFIIMIFVALIFTLIKGFVDRQYYANYNKAASVSRKLFLVITIIVATVSLCNIFPSVYFASGSIDYIQTDLIAGNNNKAQIPNIHSIEINILDPKMGLEECPFIADIPGDCAYRYEIIIIEKSAKSRVFFEGYICSDNFCAENYILQDSSVNKRLLQLLSDNEIAIKSNYSKEDLEDLDIPDIFKESIWNMLYSY